MASRLFRSFEATLQWLSTPLLPIYTPSSIRCKSLETRSWLPRIVMSRGSSRGKGKGGLREFPLCGRGL
jgi:hypothetical protein